MALSYSGILDRLKVLHQNIVLGYGTPEQTREYIKEVTALNELLGQTPYYCPGEDEDIFEKGVNALREAGVPPSQARKRHLASIYTKKLIAIGWAQDRAEQWHNLCISK